MQHPAAIPKGTVNRAVKLRMLSVFSKVDSWTDVNNPEIDKVVKVR
jgi:hypothetical protein